jgi:hypothetical protein
LISESRKGDAADPEHRGQQQQEEVEAVDSEAVVDAEPGDPGLVDRVLQARATGVEADDDRDREAERGEGPEHRPGADRPARQEEADEAERKGCPEKRAAHELLRRK